MSSPNDPLAARADAAGEPPYDEPRLDAPGVVTSEVTERIDALIAAGAANDAPVADAALSESKILFNGDSGALRPETRKCLVALLYGPSIDGRRQEDHWAVLQRDQVILRSALHNIFLDLVIDEAQQVAFIRQVPQDGNFEMSVLLRRKQLTLIETALVLFLRQRLTEADSADERAVVSTLEMTEHLAVFKQARNTDLAGFNRQRENAIKKCKDLNLIRPIRSSDGRFEVSPTLKLLFTADDILALTAAYAKLKSGPPPIGGLSLDEAIARDIAAGEDDEDQDEE